MNASVHIQPSNIKDHRNDADVQNTHSHPNTDIDSPLGNSVISLEAHLCCNL